MGDVGERACVLERPLGDDRVDAGERAGARRRRPGERAAGLHVGVRHDGFGGQHGGDRLAAGGDALAHQQDVRLKVPELGREHGAAAAEAGLHLVEDEHPAEASAEAGEPPPERRRRRQDAALADDGLDEHAGDLFRVDLVDEQVLLDEVGVERVVVGAGTLVEGSPEAVRIGREHHPRDVLGGVARHLGEVGAGGGREVGRLAVVLAVEAEDHRPPRRLAGELHARLDGLGAADARTDAGDARRRDLDQTPRQRQRRFVHHVVGDLHAVAVLGLGRGAACRRVRTERGRPPRRDVVDEGVAVDVLDQPVALARLDERHVDVLPHGAAEHGVRRREEACGSRARQRGGDARQGEGATVAGAGIHDGALQCRDGS